MLGRAVAPSKGLDRAWGSASWISHLGICIRGTEPERVTDRLSPTPLLLPFWWGLGPVEAFETKGCQRSSEWAERRAIGGQHCSDTKPFSLVLHTCMEGILLLRGPLHGPCLMGPTAPAISLGRCGGEPGS